MCFDKGTMQLMLLGVSGDDGEQYLWSKEVLNFFVTMNNCGLGSGGSDPAALLATSPQSPPPVSRLARLCIYL